MSRTNALLEEIKSYFRLPIEFTVKKNGGFEEIQKGHEVPRKCTQHPSCNRNNLATSPWTQLALLKLVNSV